MAGREQPYDPYIPSGSNGQQGGGGQYDGGNARTAAIQSVGGYNFITFVATAGRFARL